MVTAAFNDTTKIKARDIILAAEDLLRHSYLPELGLVFCSYYEGILTLSGCVSRPFLRQIAPMILEGLDGVEAIDNHLLVIPPDSEPVFSAGPELSKQTSTPGDAPFPVIIQDPFRASSPI